MRAEAKLREQICTIGRSIFDRGLTSGSTGNISARLDDGTWLMTPTNASLGRLDPARISKLDANGNLLSGDPPSKEIPLHSAMYDERASAGAIVHLHSTHSVAVSMLPEVDPDNVLPPLTAYYCMRCGRVPLLPYFIPGDPKLGDAIRGVAGKASTVLLANHGPVVAGKDLEAATNAVEELEETAKLYLMLRNLNPRLLTPEQVAEIERKYPIK
ncbi:3-oxo-tetronate 4-phosphate decarboxylase [Geminicoccus flavidas]|uniref:3-oxo-tetronate 4-phosphate decarboxylase n=1 Tax=Geminicoccus flavidas TaxID=2506407 RepID=UPI00135A6BBF|nr:3-oxo-tetronate 4-phosphate decarboxylase [Geminicoccus flavidas]